MTPLRHLACAAYVSLMFILMLWPLPVLAQHQVHLEADGANCNSGTACGLTSCLCDFFVYRAPCTAANNCPAPATPVAAPFVKLPVAGMTKTVGASSTHMTYDDTQANLTDGSIWTYTITTRWTVQNPSSAESGPSAALAGITIPGTSHPPHQATLNYSSSSCTTANRCWPQLWRAMCDASGCPAFSSSTFTQLTNASLPVFTETATGTTWQFQDNDPTLQGSTTYVYVSTTCYQPACAAYSAPSPAWSGTTGAFRRGGDR